MAEIASLVGYGFIVVDLEHGPADYSIGCIRATEVFGCKTVIRVLEISAMCAKRALDLGLDGIMFPKVETGKAAAEAVSFCSYTPHGIRECAYSLVRDSEFGFNKSYLEDYCDNKLIMCQTISLINDKKERTCNSFITDDSPCLRRVFSEGVGEEAETVCRMDGNE